MNPVTKYMLVQNVQYTLGFGGLLLGSYVNGLGNADSGILTLTMLIVAALGVVRLWWGLDKQSFIFEQAGKPFGFERDEQASRPSLSSPTVSMTMAYGAVTYWADITYTNQQTGQILQQVTCEHALVSMMPESTRFTTKYVVLRTPLATNAPHIFIDATSQNTYNKSSEMWAINNKLEASTKIQDLEGDFYKYFNVYAVDRDGLDALTIITPDVMLKLREQGYDFDYEIRDKWLYIIRDANLTNVDDLTNFIAASQTCLRELVPQIAHKSFSNFAPLPLSETKQKLNAIVYSVYKLHKALVIVAAVLIAGELLGEVVKQYH